MRRLGVMLLTVFASGLPEPAVADESVVMAGPRFRNVVSAQLCDKCIELVARHTARRPLAKRDVYVDELRIRGHLKIGSFSRGLRKNRLIFSCDQRSREFTDVIGSAIINEIEKLRDSQVAQCL